MYERDWILRQIQSMIKFIARSLFKKEDMVYEIRDKDSYSESDLVYRDIIHLLNERKINEAEDLLFEKIRTSNIDYLKIALDFYSRLNQLSDEQLEINDFSREEIRLGVQDVMKLYNLEFPSFE